ncbi:MAG: maleylacetoacetate isomerase [Azospirillaceae bacterium]
MKIFSYFRSSAAYRLRIALALKGIDYEADYVHLRRKEHKAPDYLALNPQGLVPTLIDDDGTVVTQSLAQMEYLEETRPEPPLLPGDAAGRARVRALSQVIACEIHPVNNLRILLYLVKTLEVGEEAKNAWYLHWVKEGFDALESMLSSSAATGRFCHGDRPTIADACLVPQVFNAERFGFDIAPYPTIARINAEMLSLPALSGTAPGDQPDAED